MVLARALAIAVSAPGARAAGVALDGLAIAASDLSPGGQATAAVAARPVGRLAAATTARQVEELGYVADILGVGRLAGRADSDHPAGELGISHNANATLVDIYPQALLTTDTRFSMLESVTTTQQAPAHCPVCAGAPGARWMGMCDQCDDARKARLVRSAHVLDAYNLHDSEAEAVRFVARRHGYVR